MRRWWRRIPLETRMAFYFAIVMLIIIAGTIYLSAHLAAYLILDNLNNLQGDIS